MGLDQQGRFWRAGVRWESERGDGHHSAVSISDARAASASIGGRLPILGIIEPVQVEVDDGADVARRVAWTRGSRVSNDAAGRRAAI
jgi:hypothetical protein